MSRMPKYKFGQVHGYPLSQGYLVIWNKNKTKYIYVIIDSHVPKNQTGVIRDSHGLAVGGAIL